MKLEPPGKKNYTNSEIILMIKTVFFFFFFFFVDPVLTCAVSTLGIFKGTYQIFP